MSYHDPVDRNRRNPAGAVPRRGHIQSSPAPDAPDTNATPDITAIPDNPAVPDSMAIPDNTGVQASTTTSALTAVRSIATRSTSHPISTTILATTSHRDPMVSSNGRPSSTASPTARHRNTTSPSTTSHASTNSPAPGQVRATAGRHMAPLRFIAARAQAGRSGRPSRIVHRRCGDDRNRHGLAAWHYWRRGSPGSSPRRSTIPASSVSGTRCPATNTGSPSSHCSARSPQARSGTSCNSSPRPRRVLSLVVTLLIVAAVLIPLLLSAEISVGIATAILHPDHRPAHPGTHPHHGPKSLKTTR